MDKKEYNEKALNDTFKNAHIALQSITDLLPEVNDKSMKKELETEYKGYNKVIDEIKDLMINKGIKPKDINPIKKAFMKGSIKMKTMVNNSKNQVADMMIKGSVTGINELTAMVNEKENLEEDVLQAINNLLSLEENYQTRLKKFL